MWKGAWRLGRESGSKPTNRRTENNSSASKSNNKNSTVEGDNIKVTLNLQNIFPLGGLNASVVNQDAGPSSRSLVHSDSITGPSDLSATTNYNNRQNDLKAQHDAVSPISTAALFQASASNVDVREASLLSVPAYHPTNPTRRRTSSVETIGQSLYSVSEHPKPKPITSGDMRRHLPKGTDPYIQAYMSSAGLFGSNAMIPLWKPSPSDKSDVRKWRHHIYVGDVGIFNAEGGFDTLFNIFKSKTSNREGGYEPPNDFVPYPKSLEEMSLDYIDFQQSTLPLVEGVQVVGFGIVSESQPKQSHLRATSSYQANGSECSAICLRAGFLKVSIRQWEQPRVLEYIRDHQESWQRHVEETAGTHFRDRPLLVIYATCRTRNYALATGSRPWPQKCQGIITLKDAELIQGVPSHYEWEVAGDSHIFTKFGPSPQLAENQDSYFEAMDGPKSSPSVRREAEECHCVAIGAFGLRKRGWIRGGSVKSGRSSRTTIRPIWTRNISLPTQLDSGIQEEVEF